MASLGVGAVEQPGYAVVSQSPKRDEGMYWGGSAASVLVWVIIVILILAILASLFLGGNNFLRGDSSDDRSHGKGAWDLNWLGGLVVFIVVILFLCWLIGAGGRHY